MMSLHVGTISRILWITAPQRDANLRHIVKLVSWKRTFAYTSAGNWWLRLVNSARNALTLAGLGITKSRSLLLLASKMINEHQGLRYGRQCL